MINDEAVVPLASFGTEDPRFSVTDTRFDAPVWNLFGLREFGPPMGVYRLDRQKLCKNETDVVRSILKESGSAPQGMFGAHRFALDNLSNVHIAITSENSVDAALFTEKEFERVADKSAAAPIAILKASSSLIPRLGAGRYVLLAGSEREDVTYAIEIQTDSLIFR